MYKKILGILICMLFIGTSFIPNVIAYLDQLDQSQTCISKNGVVINNVITECQEFKPTLNVLTKVEIHVYSYLSTTDLICSIKKQKEGSVLTSVAISSSSIPSIPPGIWIEANFPDITVVPNDSYWICLQSNTPKEHFYVWTICYYNPYPLGDLYYYNHSSGVWTLHSDGLDASFKTYGYNNYPPNTPNTPSGPTTREIGQSGTYSTSATDPDGHQVQYRFDWDAHGAHNYSSWTSLDASGHTDSLSHSWGSIGTYVVKAQTKDQYGSESAWSTGLMVGVTNTPPNVPTTPSGPETINIDVSGTYSTSATDPDGHQVQYRFDWDAHGAHNYSSWTSLDASGHTDSMSHSWSSTGTFVVKAQARDQYNGESGWSTGLTLVVSSPEPDLECEGTLSWTNVKSGSTVNGTFIVKNIGETGSKLHWEVDSLPDWGNAWAFAPSEGLDLTPEEGKITVQVSLVAPKVISKTLGFRFDNSKEFTGNVTVVNMENPSDKDVIPISITVSKSKTFSFFRFFECLFYRFPFFEKILNQPL